MTKESEENVSLRNSCGCTATTGHDEAFSTVEDRTAPMSSDSQDGTLKSSAPNDSTFDPLWHRLPAMPVREIGSLARDGVAGNGLLLCGRMHSCASLVRLVRREVWEEVLHLIAERYRLTPQALRKPFGKADAVWAKQMAMAVMRRLGASLHEIAAVMDLTNGTIAGNLKRFVGYLEVYPHCQAEYWSEVVQAISWLKKYRPTGKHL